MAAAVKLAIDDGYRDIENAPLVDGAAVTRVAVYDKVWWRLIHALAFATGGLTFIAGTGCLYAPASNTAAALLSAVLYIIGSLGFLTVDVQEFFTFTDCAPLRWNISLSAIGSTLYVLGSIGFIPSVITDSGSGLGVWGFILGSAFIGVSQLWKCVRLSTGESGWPSLATVFASRDTFTATGVEAGAGVGAWFFFGGTILYNMADPNISLVLALWMCGSVAFTLGAAFLSFRHFAMRVT